MAENKGKWLDSKTGKVVDSQPEEGVQLLSPNVEPTPNDEAAVKAAEDAAKGEDAPKAAAKKPAKGDE